MSGVAFLGIDPGIHGAIAVLHGDEGLLLIDTPSQAVKVGGATRAQYDIENMAQAIKAAQASCRKHNVTPHVVIEHVGVLPHDGRVGAFSFGFGFGAWRGILHALNLPYTLVRPVVWKKRYGLLGADKRESIPIAAQLYPEFASRLTRIKDHDRADAILLARWGRETIE